MKNRFVININNLCKRFGEKKVLENITLDIQNGSRLTIKGKNGSGKTTLLKILTGHLQDYSGSYQIAAQAHIAYYAQEHECPRT